MRFLAAVVLVIEVVRSWAVHGLQLSSSASGLSHLLGLKHLTDGTEIIAAYHAPGPSHQRKL